MLRTSRIPLSFAALAAFLLLAPAFAPPAAAGLPTQWDEPLAEIEADVERGKYDRALRRAEKLTEKMVLEVGAFPGEAGPLARAATALALARAGVGDRDAALWSWAIAQNLDPAVRRRPDLERFGDAGRLLADHPLRLLGTRPDGTRVTRRALTASPEVVDAQVRASCGSLRYSRDVPPPPPLEVEVVIDEEGWPRHPVLVTPARHPGFAYMVLEGLQRWRFKPAEAADSTVAVLEVVSVGFPVSLWR